MINGDEEVLFGGLGGGCMVHGDDYMRECALCGTEFCGKCHPGSAVCSDCVDEDDPDDGEDGEDALETDGESDSDGVDELLEEADGIPAEDLLEDDEDEDDRRA